MRPIALFFIFLAFSSCKNSPSEPKIIQLPTCVENIIQQDTTLLTVQAQFINGEPHFLLNTDARFVDGIEAIVNNQCDTVCSIGGWFPPNCSKDYKKWKVIWEK